MNAVPGLPGPLDDPLHLLEPTWSLWPALVLGLLASALFAWLRHRDRRWRTAREIGRPEATTDLPAPPAAGAGSGIETRIDELRRRHRLTGATRKGCDELSALLRGHLAGSLARHLVPSDPDCLTGRETGWLFGGAVHRFFLHLTSLQFGRREPTGGDFDAVCDLAVEVARSEPTPKRRWARRGAAAEGRQEPAA